MKKTLLIYDSFSNEKFKGNPAGVVIDADDITENKMLLISKELGYSETAFILKSNIADFKVKFFTPTEQVDLCGHATIAYVTALIDEKIIKLNNNINIIKVETNIGVLPIYIDYKNDENRIKNIMMLQDTPKFKEIDINIDEIADSLSLSVDDIDNSLPILSVYTGLWDIIIPIKNLTIFSKIKPHIDKIININKKTNTISYHLFVFDAIHKDAQIHVRNFAPIVSINEESATGTSNAALGCYLVKYGKLELNKTIVIEQGIEMNRKSNIYVKIEEEKGILKPYVGGLATCFLKGTINL